MSCDRSQLSQTVLLKVLRENARASVPFLRYFDVMFFKITTSPSVGRFIATREWAHGIVVGEVHFGNKSSTQLYV